MPRKLLEVVADGHTPAPRRPTTIKAAVERDEATLLKAMRARIATEIDGGVPPHTLAPLMRQLHVLDKEIRALAARDEREARDAATEDEAWSDV